MTIGVVLLATSFGAGGTTRLARLTLSRVNNSGGTAKFIIERRIGTTGTYRPIATTGTGITTYTGSEIIGGRMRTTTFVSETQLTAAIPAIDIAIAGKFTVTVFTPAPGGGPSDVGGSLKCFVENAPAVTKRRLAAPRCCPGPCTKSSGHS